MTCRCRSACRVSVEPASVRMAAVASRTRPPPAGVRAVFRRRQNYVTNRYRTFVIGEGVSQIMLEDCICSMHRYSFSSSARVHVISGAAVDDYCPTSREDCPTKQLPDDARRARRRSGDGDRRSSTTTQRCSTSTCLLSFPPSRSQVEYMCKGLLVSQILRSFGH